MLKVVWNIFKSFWGLIISLFRPFRRLICRRRRSSENDSVELTSIGTVDLRIETPKPYGLQTEENAEIEMDSWDSWGEQTSQAQGMYFPNSQQQSQVNNSLDMPGGPPQAKSKSGHTGIRNYYYNQKAAEVEPEPEPNFFQDMTPEVKKQQKLYIRKKDGSVPTSSGPVSNRLAVMSDIPPPMSELGTWEEQHNAWDSGETLEDLTWQAEEAIREKRRKERMERQAEQQRRKQKKDEMRGIKNGGSLVATKLS